ncbi:hypothetical protein J2T55_002653 [Methylohalomonas lacus]|uniref:Uncharacterized protein n=1 Tax=Methylohalomonas lacus TaxID=398773 RepID=A0AAE3L4W5_9GAMM|nr:hypothetical protein [Methylohalomonas lacus]MCS3904613.1 hypothetical protein [Methylohalomonas lacus]
MNPNLPMNAAAGLTRRPLLMRALLLLVLLMQYAAVTHAAAHHLFDTPLHAETAQCDGFHLQQSWGQPSAPAGCVSDTARGELAVVATLAVPPRSPAAAFQPRAPPRLS